MKSLVDFIFESEDNANVVNGFCILKPGFMNYEEDFLSMLKNNNWNIVQKNKKKLDSTTAAELYKNQSKEDFYGDLVKYMSSDECLCCSCYKKVDNPIKDMDILKDKIRKAWGKDDMKNAMHSSDSIENVNRESKLIFNNIK